MSNTTNYSSEEIKYAFDKINQKIKLYIELKFGFQLPRHDDREQSVIGYNSTSNKSLSIRIKECTPIIKTKEEINYKTIEEFDPEFWSDMVVYMNNFFDDRDSRIELSDGNPCCEVRRLRNSICHYRGQAKQYNYVPNPLNTITKIPDDETIKITRERFMLLKDAFRKDLEENFVME